MPPSDVADRRPPWTIFATIAGFTIVAVYCTTLTVYMTEVSTGAVVEQESLKQYHQALAGVGEFPYQWRLLGTYMVAAGERLTGLHPHTIDVGLKALLLFASATTLFLFCRLQQLSEVGALCATAFYLLATVVGFSDHFRIYFTNDYVMIACWFAAVYFVATDQFWLAALMTFVGAWAKETMLLVPLLVLLRRRRGGATNVAVAATVLAFLLPTIVLRVLYRAPIGKWAWWEMIFINVPFMSGRRMLAIAVRSNLKLFMLYNALWIVAARSLWKAAPGTLARDLAVTGAIYLVLAFSVVFVGELRHFLPLAIVVLPVAIGALERRSAAA